MAIFAVFGLCIALLTALVLHQNTQKQELDQRLQSLLTLSGDITYLDEVLTMSARMFAFTANDLWQLRYDEHVPILDNTLESAIALDSSIDEHLRKTSDANQRLIDIELRAFELTKGGNSAEAIRILTDANYRYIKQQYSDGLNSALSESILALEKGHAELTQNLRLLVYLYMGMTIFFIGSLIYLVNYSKKADLLSQQLVDSMRRDLVEVKKAEKALRDANEMKTRFIANCSHEMNTPLNGLIGNLQLLEDEVDSAKAKKILNLSSKSAYKLAKLVRNILDFAELESGTMRLTADAFDVVEATQNVAKEFELSLAMKDVTLQQEYRIVSRIRQGDNRRYSQIVRHILNNACKFTEKGHIEIRLSELEADVLHLQIKDTGVGIDEAFLERVCEQFAQADISTTKRFDGLGLGMSITYSLVNKMNGSLAIESKKNIGTTVSISLPLEALGRERLTQSMSVDTPAKDETTVVTVLVVEDDEINQEIIKNMLIKQGYDVLIANNGADAIDAIHAPIDIVLMDIQMPIMDGIEACKRIKAIFPQMPVIALTANVSDADMSTYHEVGFDEVLAKPYSRYDIQRALVRYTR